MNKLFLFCLLFSVASCANSQENKTTQSAESEMTTLPKQPAKTVKKAPELTAEQKKKLPRNYIVENSRQAKDIDDVYPYDIDFKLADGKIVKSSEILEKNDKPTVLMFWLTTCVPCRYEMKAVSEKYADWKAEEDFNLYAISTDFAKNYESFVRMVDKNNWPWESVNDVNREFRRVMPGELNGLPQTFIIDKNGEIAYHKRKYRNGDEDALFAKIQELNAQ
ncbi:MAG: peroxiredoxin [Paraglaciecola sp.]|jgi:peroxiredoxin